MRPRSPRKPKEIPCRPLVQRTSSERDQVLRGQREPVLLPMLKKPETETLSIALYPDGCQILTPKSLTLGTPGGTKRLLCSRWKPNLKSLSKVGLKMCVSCSKPFCTKKS